MWVATVKNRTHGTGCPFCSGTAVCQHNSLATRAPQVALLWDAKKNHPMSPDQVTACSHMRAHWKCSVCLHQWQAAVKQKTRSKTGCPNCAKANAGRKADGTRQKHPTFANVKHALLEQWDHDRNRRMETSLQIQHYEATNSFGGAAKVVQKARCTAGKLRQPHVPLAEVALFVLGRSCVCATL